MDLLRRSSSDLGFVASAAFDHYDAVWTRDAAISSLGALLSGQDTLIQTSIRTLETMGATVGHRGQVAAVVRDGGRSWDWAEGGVVDSTAWFVILAGAVVETTGDGELARRHWPAASRALDWLASQDVTGTGLISAAPGTDWMDSSLVRFGRTLHLNVLYFWALRAAARLSEVGGGEPTRSPGDLASRINLLFWPTTGSSLTSLYQGSEMDAIPDEFPHTAIRRAHREAILQARSHYVSHVVHAHFDEHCDVLANILAVCTGVANAERAGPILDHLDSTGVDVPFPSRVWTEPISDEPGSGMHLSDIETHLDHRWRNPPFSYHNGGVWPYVGGFHATALALAGRVDRARQLLNALASANRAGIPEWGFHEWLHGRSGTPSGARDQTWNAGSFVLAREAIVRPDHVMKLFGLDG